MPDLVEQMYCTEQIHIPPTFPNILKQYAKAAIRTQPYDLLRWSAAYFRAMANGEEPPVKQRLEYPPIEVPSGITPGYLKVLLKQFEGQLLVREETLYDRWQGMCLNEEALSDMLNLGGFDELVDLLKFIALAAGHLTNSLSQTMVLICELLTQEPEGGSAMIPCDTFCNLYSFLARLDCGPVTKQPEPETKQEEGQGEGQKEVDSSQAAAMEAMESAADAALSIAYEARDSAVEVLEELTDRATFVEARESVAEVLDDVTEKAVSFVEGEEPEVDPEKRAEAREVAFSTLSEVVNIIPSPQQVRDEEIKRRRTMSFVQVKVPGIGAVVEEDQIESVVSYMKYWAERQEGMVMPRNIRHFLCPLLDPIGTVQTMEADK